MRESIAKGGRMVGRRKKESHHAQKVVSIESFDS